MLVLSSKTAGLDDGPPVSSNTITLHAINGAECSEPAQKAKIRESCFTAALLDVRTQRDSDALYSIRGTVGAVSSSSQLHTHCNETAPMTGMSAISAVRILAAAQHYIGSAGYSNLTVFGATSLQSQRHRSCNETAPTITLLRTSFLSK